MKIAGIAAGLLAGATLLPASASAYTCAQVIWAVQNYTVAEIEAMAAKYGGISAADRAKAHKCLREAGASGRRVKVKAASAAPVSESGPVP